jgi:superfamily II DNA/RNA helicase
LTSPAPTTTELVADGDFATLGVPDHIVASLAERGITSPYPIQHAVIPDALAGRDVTGKAKTGSGKTLAFGIPMVLGVDLAVPKRPRALILAPTRELVTQLTEELRPLAEAQERSLVAVYGGSPIGKQINALRRGVEIIVATPGRLIDLIERREVTLEDVTMVTIDEADQMADMGFLPQVRRIMRTIGNERQTMLFSATLDGQVGSLIRSYMNDPVAHEVESATEMVDTMEHRFLEVHYMDKAKVAAAISRGADRTLMFVRTKHGCDRVARDLREIGVDAAAIHGDLPQVKREQALRSFTDGSTPVLVATNVAARGLHVEGVDIVIHYDPPDDPKMYLHRSGRTARAGESGLVVTLVEWDQMADVIMIQRRAGLNIAITKMFSNDRRLSDLTEWQPPEDDAPIKPKVSTPFRGGPRRRRRR